jgi:[calcium/calmodulin-dependent protein kinase] kinase
MSYYTVGFLSTTEGTFPFYSPEMCMESSSAYSAYMADTWAASVCLWIFIFGVLPFQHTDVTELFNMIRYIIYCIYVYCII